MKVGFDGKRVFYNRSGLGNYSRDLITILSKFTPENRYIIYRGSTKPGVDFSYENNVVERFPGLSIYAKLSSLWRSYGIVRDIIKDKLDIYHGLSGELPFGIKKAGCKSVVTVHDCIFMRYPELYHYTYIKTFEAKNRYSLKVADEIIAISEQTKDDIVKYFGIEESRISVVYQGCNDIFREKKTERERDTVRKKYSLPDKFILYVGTIEPRKNLMSVFEGALKSNRDIPIVAVGRATEYQDKVKQFTVDNNMESRSYFLNNVETEDLPAIYQMASIFIYPSIFEGFGIPILEALCSGTAVITTDKPIFHEVGGDAAEYVPYGDSNIMASKISLLLENDSYRDEKITKGFEQSELFTKDKIADNILEIYQR